MIQKNIRDYNNQEYSKDEGSEIIKELDDRTKSEIEGYNSIGEIGAKTKELVENPADNLNIVITDNLLSSQINRALSANQGRVLKNALDAISVLLSSDDTTLDELQEIVSFIKQNKSDLQNLSISNIAGLNELLDLKFDSVNTMKSAQLVAGDRVKTTGYLSDGDGGGNAFRIVDDISLVEDFGVIHHITGNLYAVAENTSNLNNKHYGIFADSSTNWESTPSYNSLKLAAVKYGITFESPKGTYFNCQLNLNDSHSGAKIHFNNAVFSDIIHFVGTDTNNRLEDCLFTGHISTYDRFGQTYTRNILGALNVTCKDNPAINPSGVGGRGVHIYHTNENSVYGNFVIENNDTEGGTNNVQAGFALDGITNTSLGNTAPINININSIWVQDCETRGVQITGEGHHIGSIRVDRFGSDSFDSGMPSMNTTTYNGETSSQIAQGVLFLYTDAVVDRITVNQLDGFVGRSRALTDVAIARYTLESSPTIYTRKYPTIGSIISTNPQRQVLSVGATQRPSGVNIGSIQISEISSNNILELNASGERLIYGLVDCYYGVVNINSIQCYDYKNATLLSQLDQGYSGTLKQQTLINVGSIQKEKVASTGKTYDIFQGAIAYILSWGDANNKSNYKIP